jgi:hypothetical protein
MRIHGLAVAAFLAGCASSSSQTTLGTAPTQSTTRVSDGTSTSFNVTTRAVTEPNVASVPYSRDQVWAALPAVFESLSIAPTTRDQMKRVMGNPGFNVRRRLGTLPLARLIDCGSSQGAPNADTYELHLIVLTTVLEDGPSSSKLSTTVEAMGRPVSFSGEYIRCTTLGALETRIAEGVKAQMRK